MTQNVNKNSAKMLRFSGVFLVMTLLLLSAPKAFNLQANNSSITLSEPTQNFADYSSSAQLSVTVSKDSSGVFSANTNQANVLFSDASGILSKNISGVQNAYNLDNTESSAALVSNAFNENSQALQFAVAYSAAINFGQTSQNITAYQLSSGAAAASLSLPAVNSFTSKIILQLIIATVIALYVIPRKEKFTSVELQIIGVMRC